MKPVAATSATAGIAATGTTDTTDAFILTPCEDIPGWTFVDRIEAPPHPSRSAPVDIPGARAASPGRGPVNRVAQARRMVEDARRLAADVGFEPAPGGTSGALALRDRSGRLRYLFKPVLTEVDGPAARGPRAQLRPDVLREALATSAGDEIHRQTGLDLGFPRTTTTVVQGRPGVLIEGVDGDCLDHERWFSDLASDRIDEAELRRQLRLADTRMRRIPLAERQSAMLAKLALGDLDIKWGNLVVGPGPERHCHPIDFGFAFPNEEDLRVALDAEMVPETLAYSPSGRPDPEAARPFHRDLRQAFLRIDVRALDGRLRIASRGLGVQALEWERWLPRRERPSPPTDADIARAMASLRLTQRLLRDDPGLSMQGLARRYAQALPELVVETEEPGPSRSGRYPPLTACPPLTRRQTPPAATAPPTPSDPAPARSSDRSRR